MTGDEGPVGCGRLERGIKKIIESIESPRSVHCDDLRVCTYAEGVKYDRL